MGILEAAFLTPLRVEETGVDEWRLIEPLVYSSPLLDVTVTIPAGWITDFESVPRWIPLAYAVLYGIAHAPAVIHDWAYTYAGFRRGAFVRSVTRAEADGLIYEAMRTPRRPHPENEVPRWKAWIIWIGLRVGGWITWRDRRKENLPVPWKAS